MNRRFFNQQNLTRRLRLLPVLFAMLLMPLSAWAQWETQTSIFYGAEDTGLYAKDSEDATMEYVWTYQGYPGYYGASPADLGVYINVRDNDGKSLLTPPDGFTIKKVTLNYSNLEVTGESKIYVRAVSWPDTTTHYTDPYLMESDGTLDINLNAEGISSGDLRFLIFSNDDKAYSYILNSITIIKAVDYQLSIGDLPLTGANVNSETGAVTGMAGFYFTPAAGSTPATLTLENVNYGASLTGIVWSGSSDLKIQYSGNNTINTWSGAELNAGNDGYCIIAKNNTSNLILSATNDASTLTLRPSNGGTPNSNNSRTAISGFSNVTLDSGWGMYYTDDYSAATATSLTAGAEVLISKGTPLDITIAGVLVTSGNASNITGDNITGTVSYDAENKILTLNGAHISGNIQRTSAEDLTVNLVGSNEITIANANDCVFVGNAATASPKLTLTTDKSEPGTLKVNGLASKTSIASGWSSSSSTFVYASDGYPENGDWWVQAYDTYMEILLNRKYDLLWGGRPYCDANLDPVAGAKFVPEESTLEYGYRGSYSFTSSLPALKVKVTAEDAQMGTITFQSKGEVTSGTLTFEAKDADGKYSLSLSSNDGGPAISGFSSVNFTSPMHLTDPATVADLATASYVSIANYDSYNLQVGDINVTSLNADNILNDANATVKYNYETNTLTLNGATINGGIFCGRDVAFTVHLLGNNVIDGQYNEATGGDWTIFAETCPKLIFTTDENAPGKLVMKNTKPNDGGYPQYYEGYDEVEYASGLSAADNDTGNKQLIASAPVISPAEGVYWPDQEYTITGLSGAEIKYYYRDTVTDPFVETTASSFAMENIGRHLVRAAQTLTVDGTSFEMIGGDKVYIVRNALTFDLPEGTYGGTQNVKIENLPEGYDNTYDYTQVWYYLGDDEDNPVQYTSADQTIAVSESTKVTAYIIDGDSGKQFKSKKTEVEYTIKANPNLQFNYSWTRLQIGNTFSQEVLSDMPTAPVVTWSSNHPEIATVDETTGVVTPVAVSATNATITATFAGDDTYAPATASYDVTVAQGKDYLSINYKGENIPLATVKVAMGNSIDIKTDYDFNCPEELVGTLVWYSNDESVVTVTNGVITTVGCGSTWIKVSSAGNSNYESDYCDFNIEVAPPKPTINLAEGTYMSTHDPITITKADIANTAITYTWDDVTDYNVSPTWKDYTDAGVALQKTGTLYARVGYTTNDEGVIYSDTASVAYTVIPDIAECTVSGNDNVTYTGAAQTPTITVTPAVGGEALVLGTDYTVSYKKGDTAVESMIDAGDYTIVITAKEGSAYGGTKEVGFTIAQAKLSAVTIAAIDDQTFTGSQITPAVTVTFNEKTVSTEEYNVVYGENKNVGEGAGTVTLTSKNKNFVTSTDADATTKQTATFNIVAATAAITATDQTVTFDGEEQPFTNYTIANGEAVVTYYSSEEARTAKTGGTTNAPTNAAIYYVQVTQGDDNYTSAPANATFTISPKALTEGMVEQDGVSFTYSGYTPEYSVSVKDGEEYLAGDDYDCVIKQGGTEIIPVNAGSYDVVVTGKRNYTGTITKTLTITKAQLTVTPDDKTYNVGDNIELTVSYDGFVDGDDEDVLTTEPTASYGTADVTKPGSYEITASGGVAQNYDFIYETGTLTINRQLTVSFSASNTWATYCGTENLSTPEGLKAYQVTAVEGATVTISEIGYIPANTAVLLQNVSNNNTWTNIAASAYTGATSTFENNKLIGTASAVDVSTITGGTVYILVNNMFRRSTSGTIPANRGYLVVATSSNAPQLSISIGDENTTGVQTLNVERGTLNDDSWYTIDGRKLQQAPAQKGLYIKNGKKVFINKK